MHRFDEKVRCQLARVPAGLALFLFTLVPMGWAQGVSAVPSSLTFNYVIGGLTPTFQTVALTSVAPVNVTVAATTLSGGPNWLQVSPSQGATPTTITVSVAPSQIPAGSYSGQVKIATPGASPVVVSVTLNIYTMLRLVCTPATGPVQLGVPYSTTCTASGGAGPYIWSIGSGPLPAGLVLIPSTTAPTATVSGTPNTAGAYYYVVQAQDSTGQINLVFSGSVVSGAASFSASPPSLTFNVAQSGVAAPASIAVTGPSTPIAFQAAASTLNGGTNWLQLFPTQASTPANLGVNVVVAGLAPGSYAGQVKITPQQVGLSAVVVPVTLNVTALLTLNCSPIYGPDTVGRPYTATCTAGGGVAPYHWSISGGALPSGLVLNGSGATATINGTLMNAASYDYTVKVDDSAGQKATLEFSRNMTLLPSLSATPQSLTFNSMQGAPAPPTQVVSVASTGAPILFSIVASTFSGGANWLTATSAPAAVYASAPASVSVSVSPAGLAPGSYSGQVKLAPQGSVVNSVAVPVTLKVVVPLTMNCTPPTGPTTPGSAYVATCSASGGIAPYTWTIAAGLLPAGLVLTSAGGSATITGTPAASGNYSYVIAVWESGFRQSATQSFSGTLAPPPGVAATPGNLSLNYVQGGQPPTAGISLASSSGGAVAFTVAPATNSGGNWLVVNPVSSQTPANLTVSAATAGLSPGAYSGRLTITPANGAAASQVSVTLNVAAQLTMSCTPQSGPGLAGSAYAANCTAGGGMAPYLWAISSGSLPPGITLSATGSAAAISGTPQTTGGYSYTVTVTEGGSGQTASQSFAGTIAPAPGTPVISAGGVVNTASYSAGGPPNGGLAQGSLFSIYGSTLGPDTFVKANSYPLPTKLGGVGVQITQGSNQYDAYLVFVSKGQINAILPSNVPLGTAQVVVSYNGLASAATITVVKTRVGVFYQQIDSQNFAIAQNVNSATDYPLNLPGNPAKPGQILILWGTGMGPVSGADNIAPPAGDMADIPVTITVGGISAQKAYAGRQPQTAAVDNIYFTVPAGVSFGCQVPVAITAGGVAANLTVIAITADGSPCQ
jgi:large repetitive protein